MSEILSLPLATDAGYLYFSSEEHRLRFQTGLAALEAFPLGDEPTIEPVIAFGDQVISYVNGLESVDDEIASFFRGHPQQIENLPNLWREEGLVEPSIFPVVIHLMSYYGLWSETAIKALVLDHFYNRLLAASCSLQLYDLAKAGLTFYQQIPQDVALGQETSASFIHQLADSSHELINKRVISTLPQFIEEEIRSDFFKEPYKNLKMMDQKTWRDFCFSTKWGSYATYLWFYQNSIDQEDQYSQLLIPALADITSQADFQEFAADPDGVLDREYGLFLTSHSESSASSPSA